MKHKSIFMDFLCLKSMVSVQLIIAGSYKENKVVGFRRIFTVAFDRLF